MDPSVAMAKLLAAALENRLNAPVPDGESGTQHTTVLRLLVLLPKTIVFKLRACTVAAAQQAHMSYRRSAASHATGSMALP